MSATGSEIATSVISFERFADNVLPTNRSVVNHYQYLRKNLSTTNPKFLKKSAVLADAKQQLVNDMRELWLKAGLPVVSEVRILTQCKDIIDEEEKLKREAKKKNN